MAFISKGAEILLRDNESVTERSYLYKKQESNGSFSNAVWGSSNTDFSQPIVCSIWSTYNAYSYLVLGQVQQVYADTFSINRNSRYDSTIRLATVVAPLNSDLSGLKLLTAVVAGNQNEDINNIVQTFIDEYSTGNYQDTVAYGIMNKNIPDNIDETTYVYNVVTNSSVANSVQDYELPSNKALYLVNVALMSNEDMESITSLSLNIYQQYFIEFLGNDYTAPGSVGRSEIKPDYKPERAISNYIINIPSEHIIEDVGQSTKTLLITPDDLVEINNKAIYYIFIDAAVNDATHISLGYYDNASNEYVAYGTSYELVYSGNIAQQPCFAVIVGTNCYVSPMIIANGNNIQF